MDYALNSFLGWLCECSSVFVTLVQMNIHALTVFVLACIVGYYVIWSVTPALHAPLMSVTNAISSVVLIGAIFVTAQHVNLNSKILGFMAMVLVSINIFGGFTITSRMLNMFQKR